MTWGNKLVLVFIGFAALMGTLVYNCMKQNFELVSKDYYNDELKYQDKIDGTNNANKLSAVSFSQTAGEIKIKLPEELNGSVTSAEAWFYCATDSKNDRRIKLDVNDKGLMTVEKTKLASTNYLVKLNWQVGDKKYYNEQSITVQ
jgi:hypothetical protein